MSNLCSIHTYRSKVDRIIRRAVFGFINAYARPRHLFYNAYNPKSADCLGVLYTPGEIIDFMIRSTDTLLHRHFGNRLAKGVKNLDPATGIQHVRPEVLAPEGGKHDNTAQLIILLGTPVGRRRLVEAKVYLARLFERA